MKNSETTRDPHLWELAKRRAAFRSHLISYLIINGFLWTIWFITTPAENRFHHIPWPVWPLMGWGVGLVFHFVFSYIIKYDEQEAAEKEYDRLAKGR